MASYLLGIPVGSAINRIGLLKSPHWSQLHHHCQDFTVKRKEDNRSRKGLAQL